MPLPPLHLLAGVEAPFLTAYSGGLDALAVHDPGTRLWISSESNPRLSAKGLVQSLPGAVDAPGPEVVVDGPPRREVVGQQSPSTAAARYVEDGVEDLAQGVEARATGGSGDRQMRLEYLPLLVGEVGLVCSSHGARYPTEPRPHNPFSDSFSQQLAIILRRASWLHECLFVGPQKEDSRVGQEGCLKESDRSTLRCRPCNSQ